MRSFSFLFGALLLGLGTACSSGSSEDKNPDVQFGRFGGGNIQRATPVEVVEAKQTSISEQVISYGNVRTSDLVRVTPQVSDRITKIYVEVGDTVRAGQALAEIKGTVLQRQFQRDQAQLRQTHIAFSSDSLEFFRQKELQKRKLVAQSAVDQARVAYENSKSQVQTAVATLSQSQQNLSNAVIRSPVFGVVTLRSVSEGDLATTGTAAFEIANLTGFEVRLFLPMEDWRKVKAGHRTQFRVSNQAGYSMVGTVTRKNPQIDANTGLGEVIITLNEPGSEVYPGVLVEAVVDVETHPNAVVIPRSALVESVQTFISPESNSIRLVRNYGVFVTQGDSIALRREMVLGIQQGENIEVLSGLRAGEKLVVTGQASLEDSSKVMIANGERADGGRRFARDGGSNGNPDSQNATSFQERDSTGQSRVLEGMNRDSLRAERMKRMQTRQNSDS